MATAPWWTEADQAELNLALWTMICALETIPKGHPARGVIIDAVLEWRQLRILTSKAEWFRRRHLLAQLHEIQAVRAAA